MLLPIFVCKNSTVELSFKIAHMIAKEKKPNNVGETLCSEFITANRLSCIYLLRFCRICVFTRYISFAADSACSALPLAAQRLFTTMATVM